MWREVYINRPYRLASHTAYKGGRGWSNGQMYCFFLWKLSANALPTEWCKTNQYTWTPDLSNTRDFMKRGCAICAPLSWSELAFMERYLKSRLCGRKVQTPLWIFNEKRRMMAHFKEEEPCITVTLSFFVIYC